MKSQIALLVVAAVGALGACQEEPIKHHPPKKEAPAAPTGVEVDSAKLSIFSPLPEVMESKQNPTTDEKTSLGRMLFYDPVLSKSGAVSCNSCHDLEKFGVDGADFSAGEKGQKSTRNTPTVYNAAAQFVQLWDGRLETVEDQAKSALLDPTMMGQSGPNLVVATLKAIPTYADAFKKAFPDDADPLTIDNVAKALGAFERKLVTPSKWDKFLAGDKTALTDDEKKGFLAFVDAGCPTCHVGPLVGGTMYQKLGKEKPWPNQADKGRSAVTKSPSDDMMFRVAQLRNVEHTAPYFHDASAKTLPEAVKIMASRQLAKDLPDDAVQSIVTWLKTLSGTVPADYVKKPALPEGPKAGKHAAK